MNNAPTPAQHHQEQVYQCQDCDHTMTEQELGVWHKPNDDLVLYCKSCGSENLRLQR